MDVNERKEMSNKSTWKKALKEIYDLSRTDKEFRALALKDARAAFEKVVGEPLAKDIDVRFVEGKKERDPVVLVLPELGSKIDITEEELETVTLNFGKPQLDSNAAAAYHNWGSERTAYHSWGSERTVAYHNWGSE